MNYIYIGLSLLCFLVAFGVWILDIQKIICEELSMLQLHGVWHFLCAAATYSLFLFYNSEKKKPQFQSNLFCFKNQQQTEQEEDQVENVTIVYPEQYPNAAPVPESTSLIGNIENFICCDSVE